MSRLQFNILLVLSCVVALCLLLQLVLISLSSAAENRLRLTGEVLQAGQMDYNSLQKVANWTAQVAEKQNDQTLRDVLTQNNIQVKPPAAGAATSPSTPAPSAPTTH